MLFSGIPFLYYFLPAVLIIYMAVPKVLKNYVLLAASLIFYAWGEPVYIILMLISIVTGYFSAIAVDRADSRKKARVCLSLSIIINLGILGYFKYADFFISSFNSVSGADIPLLKVALPVGISFYTFQLISYVIDVYRKETVPQKNFIKLAVYISMFPQLIAGPIVRYTDIEDRLSERHISPASAAYGIRRFAAGLGKKVIIANTLGEVCAAFGASDDRSVLFFWLYAAAFSLQIYFDFSGYSDMAIGLGKILGFDFPENFRYPYWSESISEFWRRWHISLGSWFRDYVYIPLGGNRGSRIKTARNLIIVWSLTGLWHGAAWNFAVWGLFFALVIAAEKHFFARFIKRSKAAAHIYVILIVMISFVIFDADSLGTAVFNIKAMFGIQGFPLVSEEAIYILRSYGRIMLIAFLGSLPFFRNIKDKICKRPAGRMLTDICEIIFVPAVLVISTAMIISGSFNPFLYFRF